jgi:hypothetical protein
MSLETYRNFIAAKSQHFDAANVKPSFMPDFLFDFQKHLVEWSLARGRAAIFADCGLGKTPIQLVWAQNILRKINRPILILTPLAVSAQTISEGEKFGIEVRRADPFKIFNGINVINYEQLHKFDPSDFCAVVCDESSAIKSFDGKRRKEVTLFLRKMDYRLLCTATAAPNDYIELGTASEALGETGQVEMIAQFFTSSDKTVHQLRKNGDFWNRHKFFFKAHAEIPFWRWVCSWARALRRPSDLGFDDSRFILPQEIIAQHIVKCSYTLNGELFQRIAITLNEQREERKRTMKERCSKVAELVNHSDPVVVWCQYNQEGDLLERMIPGSVQVAGCNSDEEKEERLTAFSRNQVRVLITKPKIGAWGLNWQHCGHHTFFPDHSFEQYYQAVRRSKRFGRTDPVRVDIVATEGEAGVTTNLAKKQIKADEMFDALVREMNHASKQERFNNHVKEMEMPSWL